MKKTRVARSDILGQNRAMQDSKIGGKLCEGLVFEFRPQQGEGTLWAKHFRQSNEKSKGTECTGSCYYWVWESKLISLDNEAGDKW